MIRKKPHQDEKESFPLDHSINELEDLIAEKSRISHDDIPVLDEIIDPDTFDETGLVETIIDWTEGDEKFTEEPDDAEDNVSQSLNQEQIEMLVGKMDQRISGELDELVNILRNVIKDSIITEIQTQLDARSQDNSQNREDSQDEN